MCVFLEYHEVVKSSWNWEAVGAIGIWFIGFMAAMLTAYPLWLYHCSCKIKALSFTSTRSIYHGDGFDVVLLNKTLSPKSITKIDIVKDNKFILKIKDFDTPLILEPMKVIKIIGDTYAEILTEKNPVMADSYFIITIDGKERYIKFKGKIKKYNINKRLHKLQKMGTYKRMFGDAFLSKGVKYALYYKSGDEYKTTLILDNGYIEKSPFSFNALPKEVVRDSETLTNFIKKNFPKADFKIQEL